MQHVRSTRLQRRQNHTINQIVVINWIHSLSLFIADSKSFQFQFMIKYELNAFGSVSVTSTSFYYYSTSFIWFNVSVWNSWYKLVVRINSHTIHACLLSYPDNFHRELYVQSFFVWTFLRFCMAVCCKFSETFPQKLW